MLTNQIFYTFLLCFFLAPSIFSQTLRVKGSDTMLPMMQLQVEAYVKKMNANITTTGGGSGNGITSLLDGTADIAMSSRDVKLGEKLKFEEKKLDIVTEKIAVDALSIIVHPNNPIQKLTREQLEDIFTGKITNWKEVGGQDQKITVYTRESSSGTFEFMKEHVMNKKEFAKDAISTAASAQIVHGVSKNEGAIGYVGLAYVENIIKAISVSYNGKDFIFPNFNNAHKGIYPIARPLFLLYDKSQEKKIAPFIEFVLSSYGQKLVTHKGYVPVN
ncbi:MAG: phosphate ABC transporter substrate-binding protein [Leptospira sp.]|nr:phosphate ABC transporter substrate-binding protein [Leptospira sp.]